MASNLIADRRSDYCVIPISGLEGSTVSEALTEQDRAYIMESAHCLLWRATVTDEGNPRYFRWDIRFPALDAAQRFLPLTLRENQTYEDAFYVARLPEDRDRCDAVAYESILAGRSYTQEFRMYDAEGVLHWMHEAVHVDTIEPGKRWQIVAVCVDTTERRTSEESRLRQVERQEVLLECSRLLLESQQTGAELTELLFPYFRKHLQADHFYHYRMSEEEGMLDLVTQSGTPDTLLAFFERIRFGSCFCGIVAQTQSPLIADCATILHHPASAAASQMGLRAYAGLPLHSRNGKLLGTFAIASTTRDRFDSDEVAFFHTICHLLSIAIERYEAEAALRVSEERFRMTFERAAVGVAHVSPDGHWLRVNQRLCDILGYSREELISTPFTTLTHPDDQVEDIAFVHRALAGEYPSYSREKRYIHKSGAIIWVNITTALARDEAGTPDYFITVTEDITERKRAEAERSHVVESARCLLWSSEVTEEGGRLHWKMGYFDEEAAQRLVPIDAVSGQEYFWKWHAVRDIEDKERNYALADIRVRAGQSYQDEFRMQAADGSWHWLHEDVRVQTLEPGKHWYLVGVCTDITARKRMEILSEGQKRVLEMLAVGAPLSKTLEALLNAIEQHSQELFCSILLLDKDGIHLNHGAAPRLPIVYINAIDGVAIGPKVGACGTAAHRREPVFVADIATDPLWEEFRHLALPHGLRACWSSPIFDSERHVLGTFAVYYREVGLPTAEHLKLIENATHTAAVCINRHKVESSLRQEQARFTRIASTVPGIIYSFRLRPDGTICMPYCSPSIREIFDVPIEGLSEDANSIFAHVYPEDIGRVWASIGESARTLTDWRQEFRVSHPRKGEIWAEGRSTPVLEPDGSILWYGFISDITERKRTENALVQLNTDLEQRVQRRTAELARAKEEADAQRAAAEQARTEAERANTAKSEFLSRMSHELRTPMNSILGFAQLMEMNATNDKQAARVAHILEAGRHLLNLINEVLDLARVESGHLSLSPETVEIDKIVQTAIDMVLPLCQQNSIELLCQKQSARPIYVLADHKRLSQILLNLLSNAIKYNRPNGRISVNFAQEGVYWVRITIQDTGMGIAAEDMERLFQPFERLTADDSTIEGTGLGLALSKRLTEAMGGRIGVNSEVGKGSIFWIDLPLSDTTEAEVTIPEAPIPVALTASDHTILYIEDNHANLRLVEDILTQRSGIRLLKAMTGKEGLEMANQYHPSLILLDLHLPDMSGDRILRHLTTGAETHGIPVVIVSAAAIPAQINYLKSVGAAEYVSKPVDVQRFHDVLNRLLV